MSSPLSSVVALACFLAVTSKGGEGRMLIAQDSITTIESVSSSCNYGVAIHLKNGRKVCVLDSMEKIGQSLATQKSCDGHR